MLISFAYLSLAKHHVVPHDLDSFGPPYSFLLEGGAGRHHTEYGKYVF